MNVLQHFKGINTLVFDVDGVLTDGTVTLMENGLQARTMHVRDGLALQMAVKHGYHVLVISGGNSEPVRERFHYLGIQDVHLGVKDKKAVLDNYLNEHGLKLEHCLFMGDDLPDLELLQHVGMPVCPADAAIEVQQVCHYISPVAGGKGCVRDVIEKVLKLNGHWQFHQSIRSR